MKQSKLAALLGAGLLLGLGVAACGGSDDKTDASDTATATETSEAPPAEETSDEPVAPETEDTGAAGKSGELTVWCWDPAFNLYAMNTAASIYQQTNPDVTVNVVEVAWDDIQTNLITYAQSGAIEELPDIFLCQNNAFQKNVINYPELFSTYTDSGVDFSQYPQSVVDYSVIDGENWGLPFDNGAAIAAYRIDVLEEAGYTLDDFTDITWSQYLEMGKDIKAKTGHALLSGQAGASDMIMMMLQSAGASLFDSEGNPTIAGNDVLLKSIDMYKQLVDAGVMEEYNSWDEYIASFVNGDVVGVINGCWILGSIQTAADQSGKWDLTNLPKLDDVEGATNYSANGGSSWAISANADYELAADFLASTFAGSTELYDSILPSSGALANWLPAAASSVYAEPQPYFNNDAIYAKIVDYASKVPSNNTGVYYYEGRDAVGTAITDILSGGDPETELQEAQEETEFAMG
ncbi:MAG: extracellular solute-binding protein [Bifidobacteriaceae bacterium]|nr:extracellular solute-binding protein [Bifidobacteriaceae bacterium]